MTRAGIVLSSEKHETSLTSYMHTRFEIRPKVLAKLNHGGRRRYPGLTRLTQVRLRQQYPLEYV
jgi:hypothetical protein